MQEMSKIIIELPNDLIEDVRTLPTYDAESSVHIYSPCIVDAIRKSEDVKEHIYSPCIAADTIRENVKEDNVPTIKFSDVLRMVSEAHYERWGKCGSAEEINEIMRCATNIYIEEMRLGGVVRNEFNNELGVKSAYDI